MGEVCTYLARERNRLFGACVSQGNYRKHVYRADSRMHARMSAHIYPLYGDATRQNSRLSHALRVPQEGSHATVVVVVGRVVYEANAADALYRVCKGADYAGVPPFAEVRDALIDGGGRGFYTAMPPSTTRPEPVIKAASSEAR